MSDDKIAMVFALCLNPDVDNLTPVVSLYPGTPFVELKQVHKVIYKKGTTDNYVQVDINTYSAKINTLKKYVYQKVEEMFTALEGIQKDKELSQKIAGIVKETLKTEVPVTNVVQQSTINNESIPTTVNNKGGKEMLKKIGAPEKITAVKKNEPIDPEKLFDKIQKEVQEKKAKMKADLESKKVVG